VNRRQFGWATVAGTGLLGVGAVTLTAGGTVQAVTTSESSRLRAATAATEDDRESFLEHVTESYPPELLSGCGPDVTGRLSRVSVERGVQTRGLRRTGRSWNWQEPAGEREPVVAADCRVVEYESVGNPVSGRDYYTYRLWLGARPGDGTHLYRQWLDLSVSSSTQIERVAPRQPTDGDRIPVRLGWNGPSRGAVRYDVPLPSGSYQLHPEQTTLTEAFAPLWSGDSTGPRVVSGCATVSCPTGTEPGCRLGWAVSRGEYPKLL